MKIKFSQNTKENIIAFTIAGSILIGLYFSILNIDVLKSFCSKTVSVVLPFIIGFAVAFLLHPVMNWIEKTVLSKSKMKYAL